MLKIKNKTKIIFTTISVFLFPLFSLADTDFSEVSNFKQLSQWIVSIINSIVPILMSLSVIVVMWGGASLVLNAGDPEKRKEGRDKMLYGIIGLFVMISIWGLIAILNNTFFPPETLK